MSGRRTIDGVLAMVPHFPSAESSNSKYRAIIRRNVHPALFFVFNITFISFIQSVLLFFLAAPTYIILVASTIEQRGVFLCPSFPQIDLQAHGHPDLLMGTVRPTSSLPRY